MNLFYKQDYIPIFFFDHIIHLKLLSLSLFRYLIVLESIIFI